MGRARTQLLSVVHASYAYHCITLNCKKFKFVSVTFCFCSLQAAYTIQAALSGHRARRKQMNRFADDDSSEVTEDDDDVFLIQSSLKGHHARLEQMKRLRQQR